MPDDNTKMQKHSNKNFRKTLIIILIVLAAVGAIVWRHKTGPYHFMVVEPGVLYRSGWMNPGNQEKIVKKYEIRTVVNLCLPTEQAYLNNYTDEQQVCRKNGVELINIPMPGNTPPTEEQRTQWLNLLRDKDKQPIIVHCAQGVTRTGVMVAIYEMEFLHKDNAQTLKELPRFGHKFDVPKRKKICDYILNYKIADTKEQTKSPTTGETVNVTD